MPNAMESRPTTAAWRLARRLAAFALLATVAACGTVVPDGSGGDVAPPSLTLAGVSDGESTADPQISFAAYASDPSGVASVTWSTSVGDMGACSLVSGNAYSCGPVPLPSGATAITVRATDTNGNARTASVVVVRDTVPPSLSVASPGDGAIVDAAQITAAVVASDDRSLQSVAWAVDTGDYGTCTGLGGDQYECGPITLVAGPNTLTFTATDMVGHVASVDVAVAYEPPPSTSAFDIELRFFDESFSAGQIAAFQAAVDRWETVVVGDLQDFPLDQPAGDSCGQGEPAYTGTVDDLVIFATSFTDAAGGLLGEAGPCRSRSSGVNAGTTAVGFMRFDTEDLAALEADGDMVETIVHEMGHVLGIGTNWEFLPYFDLLDYTPSDGAVDCRTATGFTVLPSYVGSAGVDAWLTLGGAGDVPVEESGGLGTQCGHWDEETFGSELMTGFLNSGAFNPLSALSVRSLEDVGLTVDASSADPYTWPGGAALQTAGGYDIAGAERLLMPRGTIDPETGRLEDLPARPD